MTNANELNSLASTYERLNAAADLLEKDGWIQEDYISTHGRCTLGAIYQSDSDETDLGHFTDKLSDPIGARAEAFLSQYLDEKGEDLPHLFGKPHIPSWNDEPDRTAEEVIETLRAAALVAHTAIAAEEVEEKASA